MNSFIWRKNVSFWWYRDFCVFVKHADLKICDVIISIAALMQVTLYTYFFWILSPIKMKFVRILVGWMTNIYNIFLAECWRLETSSRLFYDFIKMTIQQDLAIFNGWHVLYSPFQKKMKHWNLGIFGYWVIGTGC